MLGTVLGKVLKSEMKQAYRESAGSIYFESSMRDKSPT